MLRALDHCVHFTCQCVRFGISFNNSHSLGHSVLGLLFVFVYILLNEKPRPLLIV